MKTKTQKIIEKFNQPDVNLVISEWPSRQSDIPHHGVAAFTRDTLLTLSKDQHMRFVVLSETNNDNVPLVTGNGNIAVFRIFDQHRRRLYPQILSWLAKFPAVRHVTVHSEFGAYTGISHFLLLLPFLALIRLTGRRVTYVAHNVVDNLETFAPYLNMTNDKHIHNLLGLGIGTYYRMLGTIASQIVTLDYQAHRKLSTYISSKTLSYIPHWVKSRNAGITKSEARRRLGLPLNKKIILSFGFISWYKGSDAIANMFISAQDTSEHHLVFAGGKHIVRQNTTHYQHYYERFLSSIQDHPNITYTHYIPEELISAYYKAADLVVLPYKGLMGGSGALSWAIGAGKPFLISDKMRAFFTNPDIRAIVPDWKKLSFSLDVHGMKTILKTVTSGKHMKILTGVSNSIREKRDIHTICKSFYNEVYARNEQRAPRPAWTRLIPAGITS